jgi:hypothetical protein
MKPMRRSGAKCVYCGSAKNITVDHVPPKLLLMRPYPPNIITVPACRTCNQSFQKDDEYARVVLTIDVRASRNTAAQSNLPAVLRSLQRPDARGFLEYLMKQSSSSAVLGSGGIPAGRVFELDKVRLHRTGERLIRALSFSETGAPVPHGAIIRVGCNMSLRSTDDDTITIAQAMRTLPDWKNGSMGTAFSYVASFGFGISMWFMLLYDFFFWVGTVDCRAVNEQEITGPPPMSP